MTSAQGKRALELGHPETLQGTPLFVPSFAVVQEQKQSAPRLAHIYEQTAIARAVCLSAGTGCKVTCEAPLILARPRHDCARLPLAMTEVLLHVYDITKETDRSNAKTILTSLNGAGRWTGLGGIFHGGVEVLMENTKQTYSAICLKVTSTAWPLNTVCQRRCMALSGRMATWTCQAQECTAVGQRPTQCERLRSFNTTWVA